MDFEQEINALKTTVQTQAIMLQELKESLQAEIERGTQQEGRLVEAEAQVPVGTIVASYLAWGEFQAAARNNVTNPEGNAWSPRSKWCPADGRQVTGSRFEAVTGERNVPELRGRFLRGLNTFDQGQPAIAGSIGDPDNRQRGSYQPDDLRSHRHRVRSSIGNAIGSDNYDVAGGQFRVGPPNASKDTTDAPETGGVETRPRNVAIFYYVRIN